MDRWSTCWKSWKNSLMNEDLLQDLVLYKKSHEKAISTAARSLMTLFREICPSLLVKKDRGQPTNPKAKPKAFGEVSVASDVAGLELLKEDSSAESSSDDESDTCEDETENDTISIEKEDMEEEDADLVNVDEVDVNTVDDEEEEDDDGSDGDDIDENSSGDDIEENVSGDDDIDENVSGDDEDGNLSENSDESHEKIDESKSQKRKLSEYIGQLNNADLSLRALKKLAATHTVVNTTETEDGILSNEDFQRIRELKAKKEAKLAMGKHGLAKKGSDSKASPFKIPDADQLSSKLVDPNKLEANIRRKMTKEQRLELVKAGREERGKYQSRAAVKKKKTGGLSNKEKEHKKAMPIAAKRAKVARSRHEKKMNSRHSGKQFRGKKAWK